MQAAIQLPAGRRYVPDVKDIPATHRDTLKVVDPEGREVLIMRAVKDDETGDMVATEQIQAAVVTARFRNVAERHGRIDLEFQVVVPEDMRDGGWQLRLHPDMFVLDDSLRLDDVVITGKEYRKAQLRGYQQYEKFISRIITDTSRFVDLRNLEIFLQRNIPQVYSLRTDTSLVSDERFCSIFGVSERQAVEHYTNKLLKRRNERMMNNRGKMWKRYVKSPIVTEGIRLDTVLRDDNGDFVYNYVQTVQTHKDMRKINVVLSGEIFEQDRRIYSIPASEPLTFYVSSVSAFADNTERYMTKVISRRVSANATAYIEFGKGLWDIDETLSDNRREIDYIKENLRGLLCNEEFDLDSITIVSFASPEGSEKGNNFLCKMRAASASSYFGRFVRAVRDSLRREEGMYITVGENLEEGGMSFSERSGQDIRFRSRSGGENWPMLDALVGRDTVMSETEKMDYTSLRGDGGDADAVEQEMKGRDYYQYMKDRLYPSLRSVRFDFALHRKGMVKDTVHTTELDTVYARGVQCIRDHEYEKAVELLRPYQDYNAAVAYVAMDYNKSALAILRKCPATAQVNYMLALLYSRLGEDRDAVQCFLNAVRADPSYVYRGNLDPEISVLIQRYDLSNMFDNQN